MSAARSAQRYAPQDHAARRPDHREGAARDVGREDQIGPATVLAQVQYLLNDDDYLAARIVANLLSQIEFLRPALNIPHYHHEKWDGSGYPDGLVGEQIPLEARVFAVVDVFDALISDRPYRPGWPRDKAINYICKQSGSHFDPKVVEMFMRMIGRQT